MTPPAPGVVWDVPAELDDEAVLARIGAHAALYRVAEEPVPTKVWANALVYVGERPPPHLAAERLRHWLIPWVGASREQLAYVKEHPHVQLHGTHYNARFVAQYAVTLVLAACSQLVAVDARLRAGDWRPRPDQNCRFKYLPDATALVLGYGAIGRQVAAHLKALGAEVLAVKRTAATPGPLEPASRIFGIDELAQALPLADVIVVCLPETDETRGLIGAQALELCRRDAVLVNVGRGAVVDEEALFTALSTGTIAAAGLDVWWQYPAGEAELAATFPSRFPFADLHNVVMSPHRANKAVGERRIRLEALAEEVLRLLAGEARPTIDPRAGY